MPVSIECTADEARDAIEEVIEPYLLQQGLIQRTPRGRMLTLNAWARLGRVAPEPQGSAAGGGQPTLFSALGD